MSIKVVLFDLDGTLLPMDQDVFVKAYFGGISKKLAERGYEPKSLIKAIWAGTEAMIRNDGANTNEAVFWNCFKGIFGEKATQDEPYFDEFYKTDFDKVSSVCGRDNAAKETVDFIKSKGIRVALATNPIFPAIATESRIRWAGLQPADFELYTTYENSCFSKPNPKYYQHIAKELGVAPQECLMVGNDVGDDMVAEKIGMKVFLLTDNLINKQDSDITRWPHGGYKELRETLDFIL